MRKTRYSFRPPSLARASRLGGRVLGSRIGGEEGSGSVEGFCKLDVGDAPHQGEKAMDRDRLEEKKDLRLSGKKEEKTGVSMAGKVGRRNHGSVHAGTRGLCGARGRGQSGGGRGDGKSAGRVREPMSLPPPRAAERRDE